MSKNSDQIGMFDSLGDRKAKVEAGEALKDQGMQRAAQNAEDTRPGWNEQALEMVKNFNKDVFMVEDVRQWAHDEMGLPEPPHLRAWGSVITRARKLKIVEFSHHAKVSAPGSHRAIACVWRKVESKNADI